MEIKLKKCIVFTFLLIFTPIYIHAAGVSPSQNNVEDSIRGSNITSAIDLSGFEPNDIISINPDGDIKDWIEIDTELEFPSADKHLKIPYIIHVPDDARNSVYEGKLNINSKSAGFDNDNSLSIVTAVTHTIKISVTGKENKQCDVIYGSILDSEEENNLEVVLKISNTGNVNCRVQNIIVEMYDEMKKKKIDEILFTQGKDVPAGTKREVYLVSKHELSEGRYFGKIVITGLMPFTNEQFVNIYKKGTSKTKGELHDAQLNKKYALGDLVKMELLFSNSGKVSSEAKIYYEIELDGKLIEAKNTDPYLVLPGETQTYELYFQPSNEGVYTMTFWATYNGKKSEQKVAFFKVVNNQDMTGAVISKLSHKNIFINFLKNNYVVALVLFVFSLFIFQSKKNNKKREGGKVWFKDSEF